MMSQHSLHDPAIHPAYVTLSRTCRDTILMPIGINELLEFAQDHPAIAMIAECRQYTRDEHIENLISVLNEIDQLLHTEA